MIYSILMLGHQPNYCQPAAQPAPHRDGVGHQLPVDAADRTSSCMATAGVGGITKCDVRSKNCCPARQAICQRGSLQVCCLWKTECHPRTCQSRECIHIVHSCVFRILVHIYTFSEFKHNITPYITYMSGNSYGSGENFVRQ